MTSGELKARARAKLGENSAWITTVIGCSLAVLAVYVITATVEAYTGANTLWNQFLAVKDNRADLLNFLHTLPERMPRTLIASFVSHYLAALLEFGLASLSIAVMRKGAKVGHVFSGVGKGFSLLWMACLRQMYVFLWALLFIIPGIMAAFSYELMYYVRADHPDWSAGKCLAESKRLMAGNRWRLFCLHLSFIGWMLLVLVSFGVALFWVVPYFIATLAAFYEDLLDRDSTKVDEWAQKSSQSPN